ncbi:hypothetical protein N2601_31175 (plasmid) [Rhizobium sp. CB3060]|uniref:hypothetical protein n=1 Tax=Rhizobium sp. CB3060 TaxID=3138255 RepID=UPI0021A65E9E|nr:hypothetical protein [Rhizobium tropici]UWU25452.1 hypothetical protein N2601_31175 [Rhizobium tropici]
MKPRGSQESIIDAIRGHGFATRYVYAGNSEGDVLQVRRRPSRRQAVLTLIGTDAELVKPNSPKVAELIAFCRRNSVLMPETRQAGDVA